MTSSPDVLPRLLAQLAEAVEPEDRPAVDELVRRSDLGAFRVLVVGAAKRGKSTLINALLGRPLLPTGVVPVTALATTVRYGDAEQCDVNFLDGRSENRPVDELADLVTERGNPGNRRGVAAVTVRLPVPLLAKGLELVDTPGTGSVHAHNTAEAEAALDRMDAAIFVLSADPPISVSERAFLGQVRTHAVALFCVLNKVDHLDPGELEESREFTRSVLAAELGRDTTVWPLAARAGLAARLAGDAAGVRRSGLLDFEESFVSYLTGHQHTDLRRSLASRGGELARRAAEAAAAEHGTLILAAERLDGALDAFRARLELVTRQREDSRAILDAEVKRLISESERQAADLQRATGPAVQAAARSALAAGGRLAEAEQLALDAASERIREVVDEWRHRRTAELDRELATLDTRLGDQLVEQVRAVRSAAADLFRLELVDLPAPGRLVDPGRFRFSFAPDPGNVEALATAIRTRIPGAAGRRRVARFVEERSLHLLDRQLGRAVADFRQRLAETGRALRGALDAGYAEGAGRIADAVRRGETLRGTRTAESAERRSALIDRRAWLDRIAADFAALTQGRQ